MFITAIAIVAVGTFVYFKHDLVKSWALQAWDYIAGQWSKF